MANSLTLTSSPDLLGGAPNDPRASPARSVKRARSTTPKRQISQPPETYQLQDFYIDTPTGNISRRSSPSKSIAQAENVVSPWRIRVRVEAEREDNNTRTGRKGRTSVSASPTKKVARTITTTVPLKDSDDTPAPSRRGRGRPRKSATPAKAPAKRAGTPRPGRGRKRTVDVDEESLSDTSQRSATPMVGKSRRKATPGSQRDDEQASSISPSKAPLIAKPVQSPSKRRGRPRKEFDIAVDSDADESAEADDKPGADDVEGRKVRQPLVSTSPQKGRLKSAAKGGAETQLSEDIEQQSDYDSIAEGEDFSVVSLSTLPSAQQHLSSRAKVAVTQASQPGTGNSLQDEAAYHDSFTDVPHVATSSTSKLAGLSDGKTQARRSPALQESQDQTVADRSSLFGFNFSRPTPSQLFSSPKLPEIKPPSLLATKPIGVSAQSGLRHDETEGQTAPMGTQNAAEPTSGRRSGSATGDRSSTTKSMSSLTRRLFGGFGNRTRRELRAGLRLGEELAKREEQRQRQARDNSGSEDDVFQVIARSSDQQQSSSKAPNQSSGAISYPQLQPSKQLPSPEPSLDEDSEQQKDQAPSIPDSINMKTSATTEPNESSDERTAKDSANQGAIAGLINSRHDNNSLVHHDDNSEEEDMAQDDASPGKDLTDIWQSEAQSTSNSQNNSYISGSLFQSKPRRMPLPRFNDKDKDYGNDDHQPVRRTSIDQQTGNEPREDRPSTPVIPRQQHTPDAQFTGLTNFTIDMLAEEDIQDTHKVPAPRTKGVKRSAADKPLIPIKRQRKLQNKPTAVNFRRERVLQDHQVQTEATLAAEALVRKHISSAVPTYQRPQSCTQASLDVPRKSWLEELPLTIFQTASEALYDLVGLESPQESQAGTFSVPATPAFPPRNLFTKYLPFNNVHYNRLREIYIRAQCHPELYRLGASSPCVDLLGMQVESMGWRRALQAWELSVVDDFMRILDAEGVAPPNAGVNDAIPESAEKELIGINEVVKRIFSLWVGQIQRGETDFQEGVSGSWDKKFMANKDRVLEKQRQWRESQELSR